MLFLSRGARERPISFLRNAFPGCWSFDPHSWRWRRSDGVEAHYVSRLKMRYDGDEDSATYLEVGPPINQSFYWRG